MSNFHFAYFVLFVILFVEGFGLFISKGIVDLHHGEIRVFSKGEGTGCTFTVDLPMTRKIEPIAVVNRMRRRSTLGRIVGLLSGQSFRRQSTSPAALIRAPQDANNQTAAVNPRLTVPVVNDDPAPLSHRSSDARIVLNLPSEEEVRSGASVMSIGRQSLRDLAEHDRMVTSAARQAKATTMLHRQSTDRCSNTIRNHEKGGASGGVPIMSLSLLRGEHTQNDDVDAMGSDHAADPPSQQLRPAATTAVTSSRVPSPAPLSAAVSPKSPKQSQNKQLPPQGPVYHVLVVDDSTMTRKMLMKTLRNGGITHPLNTLDTSSYIPNALNTLFF